MQPSHTTNRITLKSLLHEAWHTISHVEEGLQRTVYALATAPGRMMRAYLQGDRAPYQKPFPFLLLTTTLYAVMLHFLHTGHVASEALSEHERFVAAADEVESKYFSWLHLGLLPLYGLISLWLFKKEKYNYAEWLVVCCYIISFCLLLLIPYQIIYTFHPFSNRAHFWIQLIIVSAYTLFAISRFVNSRPQWLTVLKAALWAALNFTLFIYTVQLIAWIIASRT